jgi:Kef-type K+ transport system membrane component KefB
MVAAVIGANALISNVFLQVGLILGLAAGCGFLARALSQPLLVAFIAIGILLGPSALGVVVPSNEIELFARLGIALLLFVVGLKLDLHVIRTVGPVALASGLGQVFFTSVIGFVLALALGMSATTALYVAVALTFSSTIIIVKLLSDKREVEMLHGRIAIGFLIVQDIVVVLVMIALTASGSADASSSIGGEAIRVLVRGAGMLVFVYLLMRFVLPWLLPRIASSSELLVLFAIAMAVLGGAAGDALGFSKEVGAFLAGVSLASTPYREQIAARLVSLRDFLLLFFFIELGAAIDLQTLGAQLPSAAVLSLFVLVGNPLIVMAIMGLMGYRKRTGFLAGLTVAQISEFSLVLAALGLSLGHLDEETVGLIALVGLITISASTYMILFSQGLFARLAPYLGVFERRIPHREPVPGGAPEPAPEVIVIGLGRYGRRLAEQFQEQGHRILAVELDPAKVERLRSESIEVAYGDASDDEFLATLPLNEARWLVCTVRDAALLRMMLGALRRVGHRCRLAVAAPDDASQRELEAAGVDLVLTPYADAATSAGRQLFAAFAEAGMRCDSVPGRA